jgi:hypothetical protein
MQVTSKPLDHPKNCLIIICGPFKIIKRVGNGAYHLKLPQSMSCLHSVFNVVKLTLASSDPILGHHPKPPPPPNIVDEEEEWVVKEVLDSKMINWKLWYPIKWENFRIEHNSWKPWDSIHTPDLIVKFHWKHPGAARQVRAIDFSAIQFHVVPSHHSLKRGVDVRGHSFSPPSRSNPPPSTPFTSITPTYVIPQQH